MSNISENSQNVRISVMNFHFNIDEMLALVFLTGHVGFLKMADQCLDFGWIL